MMTERFNNQASAGRTTYGTFFLKEFVTRRKRGNSMARVLSLVFTLAAALPLFVTKAGGQDSFSTGRRSQNRPNPGHDGGGTAAPSTNAI
jgi:hypothetical protein